MRNAEGVFVRKAGNYEILGSELWQGGGDRDRTNGS